MEELLDVVTFHLPRYESTVKTCKTSPGQVNPSNLTFNTKFVAMYLLIKVKGSRPMTYQYLTVDMVRTAKENGGFIEQKKFKTASKYGFDSLILTDASMQVLDSYINSVRPLLKPQCEFVLVTKNGGQHSKLGDVMSKLVFNAIGKYIHPTRYRQIVETKSLISSLVKSKGFFPKIRNAAQPLPKFTIKSRGRAKLLRWPTSVYKNYKVPRDRKWTRKSTRGLAVQLQARRHQLKLQKEQSCLPKRLSPQLRPCAFN